MCSLGSQPSCRPPLGFQGSPPPAIIFTSMVFPLADGPTPLEHSSSQVRHLIAQAELMFQTFDHYKCFNVDVALAEEFAWCGKINS